MALLIIKRDQDCIAVLRQRNIDSITAANSLMSCDCGR